MECKICSELKPRFNCFKGKLIQSTRPFERINIDFEGPLPSSTRNKYILTIVDEYSRFPFAYPCRDMSSETVIQNLNDLFTTYGYPSYIHTDRGTSFLSKDVKDYLMSKGVATSSTTPYNPQGTWILGKGTLRITKQHSLASLHDHQLHTSRANVHSSSQFHVYDKLAILADQRQGGMDEDLCKTQ
ncbi:uncharacterized protein LOC120352208 [Nilaparvata lugens]|uniref:uncharacterized protein LOC120352208 n=1 Tax=Nilaparvata lugens TaxID=108931 RepID=UPI00193E6108|nr:uncharacterized protein LOC120352208 [Nilaparvata lugens]